MAALTGPRPQTARLGDDAVVPLWKLPVKAATKLWAGAGIVIEAGFATPARAATGLLSAGVAQETVDNTAGAAGDKVVAVRRGPFKFNNSTAGDAIAQADVGKFCYWVDDQTVAKTDGTGARSPAGLIFQVESDGVFVEIGILPQIAALALDTQ